MIEYGIGLCFQVDGVWKDWSTWHSCSVTCAGGVQFRFRDCTPPLYGGLDCPGSRNDSQACNTHNCPGVNKSLSQ